MLEIVREFARERLADSGEATATRDAHADYFLRLAVHAADEIHGPRMRWWGEAMEAEHPNLRAALDRLAETGRAAEELRLVIALGPFWYHRAHQREGADRLEAAVRRANSVDPALCADALAWVVHLTGSLSESDRMLAAARESRALAERARDDVTLAHALYAQSLAEGWFGADPERGIALAERAVSLLATTDRSAWFRAHLLGDLGAMLVLAGKRERGNAIIEEAIAMHRAADQLWGAALKLAESGLAAHQDCDRTKAAQRYGESLRLMWAVQDPTNLYHAMTGLAGLAGDAGRAVEAVRLLGVVAAIEERCGVAVHPPFRPIREHAMQRARRQLGNGAVEAILAEGRALSVPAAVEEALTLTDELVAPATSRPSLLGLTAREEEVLQLLARRLTDKEIADALFVSPRTASFHVSSVLRKLNVSSRRDAALAARLQLADPTVSP
jgi:DNA-binding CsgD family transcriptional regulator